MSSPASGLQFNIRLIDGGLTVGITMSSIPEVGSPEGLAGVLIDELKKRNIVFGLDEEAILGIMRQRTLDEEVEIAHGVPPRSGSDAEVELLLLPPSFTAQAGEDGRVDYKNLENVSQVKAGDLVSRKTPADPGEPGVNVFGKPIRPPAVRDAKHPAGRNTVVSEDHLEMQAATDGFLRWNDDKIDVVELYAVKGDVDLRTGNVRYDKDVEVLGDVTAGFEVLAVEKTGLAFGTLLGALGWLFGVPRVWALDLWLSRTRLLGPEAHDFTIVCRKPAGFPLKPIAMNYTVFVP